MNNIQTLFDQYSDNYDATFSQTWLGQYYRGRTQQVFEKYLNGKANILELNAGTGEDAIFLAGLGKEVLATDISSSMLKIIDDKIKKSSLGQRISLKKLDLEELDKFESTGFDAIVSNFGGLNCINKWVEFTRQCNRLLNSEGIVIVCLMGPIVPWEWVWFSLKGEFSRAFRRVKGQCDWHGTKIYYPRLRQFEALMSSGSFELLYRQALGVLMPPSYANNHVEKWPKSYRYIANIEEKICSNKIACRLADHYLLVFKKCDY